jgi:prophage regulatory protein
MLGSALKHGTSRTALEQQIMTRTPLRIIGMRATEGKVHLKETQIREKVKTGEFPAPVKPSASGRAIGFVESEVDAYIAKRIEARDQGLDRPSEKELARRELAREGLRNSQLRRRKQRKQAAE